MNDYDTPDRIEYPIALIAEDDEASRARLADSLRDKGCGVLEARTSVEALLLAVDYPHRIDALFTSTSLRKYCNGVELAECLRATRPEMAIFYLEVALEPREEVSRDLIQGKAVLLRKPVTAPRMEEVIGILEENRAWAEAAVERRQWI